MVCTKRKLPKSVNRYFRLLNRLTEKMLSEVTDDVWKNSIVDEYGVRYSNDGTLLLSGSDLLVDNYSIRQGTKMICLSAFDFNQKIKFLNIPDSVEYIADSAFSACMNLVGVSCPKSLSYIGVGVFDSCDSLRLISNINENVIIREGAFHGCKNMDIFTKQRFEKSFGKEVFE